ncbi:serine protease [Halobacteriovorax sp. JY17]|uniref:trypsin-like serine peptidase n=1 Tax=Halobacteriovorax sp. JY17 TaxID=2014617 RepID=UPI000C4D97BB|nr:serine protease [Halobacteriovorax sp. JY17]PIK15526.1 MAG: hypothetical protein CES88_02050 [Halobacteriovorax sp. JY17]
MRVIINNELLVAILKRSILLLILQASLLINSSLASRCERGDRELTQRSEIMRIRSTLNEKDSSCTAFLISKSCAVTAGHCSDHFEWAEFNLPASYGDEITNSSAEDTYRVRKKTANYNFGQTGDDYAVFKLEKNQVTGLYPGEVYGYLEISHSRPLKGESIQIIGYGLSFQDEHSYLSQKSSYGNVTSSDYRRGYPFIANLSSVTYDATTSGGDSGAPIIRNSDGRVIGVHTKGMCYFGARRNGGTLFKDHKKFTKAVESCLESEH